MPLVEELKRLGSQFPKTIVFTGLKWCGFADHIASRMLRKDDHQSLHLVEIVTQCHAHLTADVCSST